VVTWTVLPWISSRHTSSRWRDRSNPACNIAIGLLVVSSTVATGRLPPGRPLFMAFSPRQLIRMKPLVQVQPGPLHSIDLRNAR
jgi:hypothetical protein